MSKHVPREIIHNGFKYTLNPGQEIDLVNHEDIAVMLNISKPQVSQLKAFGFITPIQGNVSTRNYLYKRTEVERAKDLKPVQTFLKNVSSKG